jgi:hypothetical protein
MEEGYDAGLELQYGIVVNNPYWDGTDDNQEALDWDAGYDLALEDS